MNIKLSIMILSIPNRLQNNLIPLLNKLNTLIGLRKDIEVLTLIDNKVMTIGEKRNKILSISSGSYVAFLDDDDDITDEYITELMKVIDSGQTPDVICFNQHCTVNGKEFIVDFNLKNENQVANGENIKRKPYHMCVWKGILARTTPFDGISYGEDLLWLSKLWLKCKSQIKIEKILHKYIFSDTTSESIKLR